MNKYDFQNKAPRKKNILSASLLLLYCKGTAEKRGRPAIIATGYVWSMEAAGELEDHHGMSSLEDLFNEDGNDTGISVIQVALLLVW